MSSAASISEARTSPMTRDFRLSPRCLLSNSNSIHRDDSNNDLSIIPAPKLLQNNGNFSEREQVNGVSANVKECKEPFWSRANGHGRQDSVLSSTSTEISQYLSHHASKKHNSRPTSTLDSPLSTNSWSFHSRQSSLDGVNMGGRSSGRKIMTPSPLNRPPPPPYRENGHGIAATSKQISPTSLDLGYHTMVTHNNNHQYSGSSNGRNVKCKISPVLDKKSHSSNYNKSEETNLSNFNLTKLSLRKELSLLPTKNSLINDRGSIDRNHVIRPNYDQEAVCVNSVNQTVTYKGSKTKNTSAIDDSPFDKLSNELILRILSYLCTLDICLCAKVSRRFYFLAWEPSLWKTVTLDGQKFKCLNGDYALQSLLNILSRDPVSPVTKNAQSMSFKQASSVENIMINNCSTVSDIGLLNISDRCPELRRLELSNCKEITNSGVQSIATLCTSLDHLDLTGCPMISTINFEVPEPTPATAALGGVPPAPSRSLYLRHLDLTDCTRLIDTGLQVIVRNAPHLQQLFLRRCVNITDLGVKYIASYCLGLRELSISDCTQVTDFGLFELAKLGPNLRYLSVAKCDQISDSGIQQLARLCYKLRYLNLRGCESISDNALNILARSCIRLKSLDIGKCDVTDLGLKLLGEFSTSLRKLSVKSCEMITDEGIKYIAYQCKGLQHINIQDCPITVDGYRTLKKFCKKCIIEHTNPGFY